MVQTDLGGNRADAPGASPANAKLCGLTVRHDFFNAGGGRGVGIAVSPSPVTAARLVRYGLLARLRSDGIDLLWNGTRDAGAAWSEPLLFVMSSPADERFFNFTDLPFGHGSGRPILRYSTRAAAAGESAAVQTLLAQPHMADAEGSAQDEPPRSAWLETRGETAAAVDERQWFRSGPPAPPFGLVEISSPEDGGPAEYEVRFGARRTWWRYLIASGNGELDFDSLSIESKGDVQFERAGTARLPDGRSAAVFEASGALPLQQRSPERLALRGLSGGGRVPRLLIDPLPTPSAETILPEATPAGGEAQRVWSEIYVFA